MLWDPPNLKTNGPRHRFPRGGGGVKLTTHLHLVPSFKNACSYTSTPSHVFLELCLIKKGTRLNYRAVSYAEGQLNANALLSFPPQKFGSRHVDYH
jgi:hypothetical protein